MNAESVQELFEYDSAVGRLVWKARPFERPQWNGRWAGKPAGVVGFKGYRYVRFQGRTYREHRLVWLYHYGHWPLDQIDHMNGDKSDNRIENLRDVSTSINKQNMRRPRADNTSGFLGVTWSKARHAWVAQIQVNGKNRSLGAFTTPEDAYRAYLAAKVELHEAPPETLDHLETQL